MAESRSSLSMAELVWASSPQQIEATRRLFQEYGASLGFSLCFQSFEEELAELPGKYAPPDGRLILARVGDEYVGCVALRKLSSDTCEMKRLYVQPTMRGKKIGELLADAIINEARQIGYQRMVLDTVPSVMGRAVEMYRARGFKEIGPYTNNPVSGAIFLQLKL